MTAVLVDTSVLIKWFHSTGESEVGAARALRDAHVASSLDAHILDLAFYEIGNVLVRSLGWQADDVADQIDDLLAILGSPLVSSPEWLGDAAHVAVDYRLTFYDAAWVAAARGLDVPLVSADAQLLAAGLAESATAAVRRLGLRLDDVIQDPSASRLTAAPRGGIRPGRGR